MRMPKKAVKMARCSCYHLHAHYTPKHAKTLYTLNICTKCEGKNIFLDTVLVQLL